MTLKHGNVRAFYVFWIFVGLALAYFLDNWLGSIESLRGAFLLVEIGLFAIVGPIYVWFPYQFFVLSKEGNRIYATKDGIVFSPLMSGLSLQFRYVRQWSDLLYATVHCPDPRNLAPGDYLFMKFKSGGHIKLKLDKMEKPDVEQFLIAIEYLAKNCERSVELIVFQEYLQGESLGGEGLSYTKIWEDELSRRFHATSFIPLFPGTKLSFNNITIEQQIAFGGFSAVYLAHDGESNKVVVKESVVSDTVSSEAKEKAYELFEREAKILSELSHERIAKIRGSFTHEGRNYMVLDYVAGQNLRQVVRGRGKQEEPRVIQWALELCAMLEYLHSRQPPVMHRDFTPDNLVLTEDNSLTLVDFGASNLFLGTATGTLIGKQSYMPPEQIRGKANPASDCYAFGATLAFLLQGVDPEALSVDVSNLDGVSPEFKTLIKEMTDVDESTRLKNLEEIRSRLEALSFNSDEDLDEPGGIIDIRERESSL